MSIKVGYLFQQEGVCVLRYRFLIPLFFAFLCMVLGIYGKTRRDRTTLVATQHNFKLGDTVTLDPVELDPEFHYHLVMFPDFKLPLFRNAALGATLFSPESGAEVFELEDYYWHQRGTWREGGESGTWEEWNKVTNFAFRVPEAGKYQLEVGLIETDLGSFPGKVAIQRSHPFAMAEWPLFLGALVFLGVGLFVYVRRGRTAADLLRTLGYGSKVVIEGKEYEVTRIFGYEDPEAVAPGVEYELVTEDGLKRHVAVDIMEYWYEDSEGDDVVRRYHQILIEVPISEANAEALEKAYKTNRDRVTAAGTLYWYDEDNSGFGRMTDWRGGKPATIRYQSRAYRPQTSTFPKKFGDTWLERIHYAGDNDDHEWALMRIVDWRELRVTKRTSRPESMADV